jgi:hypothetical protein
MLRTVQRLVRPAAPLPPRDCSAVQAWADGLGYEFRREKEDRGFAVIGRTAGSAPLGLRPWRLEWGPSKREYIDGPELRIRASLGLPGELQMLVMPLGLMDHLERETFHRFTQQAQTEIDIGMPEEMRWLALFRRSSTATWRALRDDIGCVAAIAGTSEAWLQDTTLQTELKAATASLPGFVLMTLRGRLYLRLPMADPATGQLASALRLLDAAVQAMAAVLEAIGRRASSQYTTAAELTDTEPSAPG